MKKRWLGIMTALAGILLAGTAQAETYIWDGVGNNTRVGTANNWTPDLVHGNDSDWVFTTAGYDPGSTYFNLTARSITFSNDIDAAYSFGINRSSSHTRSLTMSSDTGFSTMEVQAGAEGAIAITATFLSSGIQNAIILGSPLDIIHNGNSNLTLSARITGTNGIVKTGSGELILGSAQNDYTGNTTVDDGTLTLSGNLLFDINTNANNNLTGTGIVNLDGTFTFDLTDATAVVADSWTIVDVDNLTETFSTNFSVIDFVDAGSDTWTRSIDASKSYEFSESTGLLIVKAGSVNSPPTAEPQSVSTFTDTAKAFTLSGTDVDGPSNLTYSVVSQPTNGTLDVSSIPNVTYTPTNGYNGADSFTFTVNDGLTNSEPATVSIEVLNYVPVADTKFAFTQSDTAVAITLSGSDAEESPLTYSVASQPANGDLTGTEPNMIYTPTNGFSGVDTFTYTVNDGDDDSASATVTISVAASGIALPFDNLDAALSGNTLTVGGIPAEVTGVSTNLDYVYSVSFTGADLDGDAANDELTFDVRVKAWTNGVIDLGMDALGSTNIASATIGTSNVAVNISSGARFTVGGDTQMQEGESLEFIIENLAVSLTDATKAGSAVSTGFNGVRLVETHNGNSHHTIFGEGTGLLGWMWSDSARNINDIDVGTEQLYVSSSITTNAATRPEFWGVGNVDFGITVALVSAEIPPVAIDISGSDLTFSWEGGGTYDVQTNASLVFPNWGVAVTNATSPATIPIGSEDVLFYKLSE